MTRKQTAPLVPSEPEQTISLQIKIPPHHHSVPPPPSAHSGEGFASTPALPAAREASSVSKLSSDPKPNISPMLRGTVHRSHPCPRDVKSSADGQRRPIHSTHPIQRERRLFFRVFCGFKSEMPGICAAPRAEASIVPKASGPQQLPLADK